MPGVAALPSADMPSILTMSAGVSYEVARLLKQVDNRLCADCQDPLTDPNLAYASLRFGVWICEACAEAHYKVLVEPNSSRLKKAVGVWLKNELALMHSAKSNAAANQVYERYVPNAWHHITPSASQQDRKQWVKAKYYSQYFSIPQSMEGQLTRRKDRRNKRIQDVTTLPTRIVDFFMVLGMGKPKIKDASKIKHIEDVSFSVDTTDCFPKPDSYPETPIPELVGPMVFPHGLSITKQELPPFNFTFVLTDINRIKLFGATLIVYELVEKEKMDGLLELFKTLLDPNQVYYAPKALTILSHYPFYTLFNKFLEQVYHVSLSTSPIPLERHVVNFMQELPLPPQGCVEVLFTLPQLLLQISRPPRNHLPMVDFSYRPLFTFFSVENVLTLFTCLCMEMTICICASNIALLTPVQEALLSLLFPFVWQGCYVPILPAHMMELLDAPVPLLVGVQDSFLINTPPHARPESVIFAHLDTDMIYFGTEEESITSKPMVSLPKGKVEKLQQKLKKHAACIHRKDIEVYEKAGHIFPHNEHLVPISEFLSEQGVLAQAQHKQGLVSSVDLLHSQSKLGIKHSKANKPSEAVPYRHPAASTLVAAHNNHYSHSTLNANNSLDPEFNIAKDEEAFNAQKVREAFLRFFVASFMDYEDFLVKEGASSVSNVNGSDKSSQGDAKESRKERKGSGLSRLLGLTSENVKELEATAKRSLDELSKKKPVSFNKEGFALHLQDDFLGKMVESQMFSNFIHERCASQIPVEITFFNENILAKENRSILQVSKNTTPFLSDETDYLKESFSVPAPNTSGLPSNSKYSYSSFPLLEWKEVGVVRRAKVLVQGKEVKRIEGEAASAFIREQMSQLIAGKSVRIYEQEETKDVEANQEQFFEISRERFAHLLHSLRSFQQTVRARKERRKYVQMIRSIRIVQRLYAKYKYRRLRRLRIFNKQCVKIQTVWRRCRAGLVVRRLRRGIALLQSLYRRNRDMQRYRELKRSAHLVRNMVLTYHLTKRVKKQVEQEVKQAKELLLYLYLFPQDTSSTCSLIYKSTFYLHIYEKSSLLFLQIVYDELDRLYHSVGFTNPQSPIFLNKQRLSPLFMPLRYDTSRAFGDLSRWEKASVIRSIDVFQKLFLLHQSSPSMETFNKITMIINEYAQRNNTNNAVTLYDSVERQDLYDIMKQQQVAFKYAYDSHFPSFPLQGSKKRKQSLVNLVWRSAHAQHVLHSAQLISILHTRQRYYFTHPHSKQLVSDAELKEAERYLSREFFQPRYQERVQSSVREVLRRCLGSLQSRVNTSVGSEKSKHSKEERRGKRDKLRGSSK